MTRISRGKVVLQRAKIDLRDVVRKATDDLRSVFARASVELRVEYVLGPVWIDGDPTRIAHVLGNLLQNSVKFTPAAGVVAVSVGSNRGCGEFRVRDTGVGMDPRIIDQMFEPFAQADQTLARTNGGLGLGLALVRGLVELHGGTVEARSEGPGRGAEFVVRLPLMSRADDSRVGERAAGGEVRRLSILVVEDNEDAAQSLADLLALNGHDVRVATDGRSGIALAREIAPDVLVCDIGLPDLSGYDVVRALRSDEALLGSRFVALSGYAQPEDRERAREAGFHAHVAKPPNIEELMRLLANED